MGVTAVLSDFCANIRLEKLPPEVVNRARFLVLDLVGNIVRARHDAESTDSFDNAWCASLSQVKRTSPIPRCRNVTVAPRAPARS